MLVVISMPCASGRWPGPYAFGFLGDDNTCRLLCPPKSVRLFLRWFLIACNQTLTDDKTGVPVCIPAHATLMAEHKRCAIRIALSWLSLFIASHHAMATSTFTAGISGIDTTGENTRVICLVLGILEDTPLHPECSFAIASAAILAFGRFEIAQVLKHQYGGLVLFGKLDNASTHQMGYLLICVANLAPEVCIVLFADRDDASLAAVACDPS